jgi:hypothetical protein
MSKPFLLALGVAAAAFAALRRRKGQDSTALWREATSDSSR